MENSPVDGTTGMADKPDDIEDKTGPKATGDKTVKTESETPTDNMGGKDTNTTQESVAVDEKNISTEEIEDTILEGMCSPEMLEILDMIMKYKQNDLERPAVPDTTSGLVLCHLSFMLDMFLPKWTVNGPMTHIVQQQMSIMKESSTKLLTRHFDDIVFVGSFSDLIYIPNYVERRDGDEFNESFTTGTVNAKYDVDILLLLKIAPLSNSLIDTSHTYPGYCQLPIKNSKGDYFTPEMLFEELPIPAGMVRTGPAFGIDGGEGFSIDLVPTLTCKSWPNEAIEWIGRSRLSGWPSTPQIVNIVQSGCHLVAKSHPNSENPDLEWRFSFVMAEKMLLSSLSIVQRQAYIICKMLIKDFLGPDMAFSSYCIKTTLFWTIEKLSADVWSNATTGLAMGVLAIIDNLIMFLTEHNVPMYFIPENNILLHVARKEVRKNVQKLILFRQSPLKVILEFDQRNMVLFVHGPELTSMFPQVIAASQYTKKTTLNQCVRLQAEELQTCFICRVNFNTVTSALGTWEQVYAVCKLLNPEPDGIVTSIDGLVEFRNLIENDLMPLLISRHEGNWCEAYRLGCLATVMSIVYLKEKGISKDSARDAKIVEDTFELALTYQVTCPITHVYYALHLIQIEQKAKALSVLELASVAFDKSRDMLFGDYFCIVPNNLDHTLQFLLRMLPKTPTFRSHIMVDYLLVSLYREIDRAKLAKQLVAFEKDCSSLPMNIRKGYSFMMLGYAYLSVNDIDNGKSVIHKACEIINAFRTKVKMESSSQVSEYVEYIKCQ